jgi:hypothetical protein
LRFYDRTGKPGEGISVGKEWTYRQYIEGGSEAAAVWTFSDVQLFDFLPRDLTQEELQVALTPRARRTAEQAAFAKEKGIDRRTAIPLEMNISVYRTYKGDIVSGILGSITVRNPTTGRESERIPFTAKEFSVYRHEVPRELNELAPDGTLQDVDLFSDFVDENGRVEIWIRCSEPAQYYGMAQPDVYIRGADGSFLWNFCKAYIGIWLQMVIITCFGVVFSTFLSGPVAMFATLVTYMVGLFKGFIIGVATGQQVGGGPLEAFFRIVRQQNLTVDLDLGAIFDRFVKIVDAVLMFFMWVAAEVFPDYTAFNVSRFVAYGFNIDGNLLSAHCVITLGFVLVLSAYGYFFLKSREIAA